MLNESQRNRNRGDSIVPGKKRQDENKRCPNRDRKREGREEKIKKSQNQQSKKEDSTQGESCVYVRCSAFML